MKAQYSIPGPEYSITFYYRKKPTKVYAIINVPDESYYEDVERQLKSPVQWVKIGNQMFDKAEFGRVSFN